MPCWTIRRSRICCQKNGKARCQAGSCRASARRVPDERAAGLFPRICRPEDGPLPVTASTRDRAAGAAPCPCQRAPEVRIPAVVHHAPPGGRAIRDQSYLPALSRGRSWGAEAQGPQTGHWRQGSTACGGQDECQMVTRLRA